MTGRGLASGAHPDPAFIGELERRRLRSLVAADLELARSLHAPDYQLVTPGGVTLTRDEYLSQIASGDLRYHVFEPEADVAVKVFVDAAAVRYVARIVIDFPGGRDDGRFWHTDLYVRSEHGWHVVWSHATKAARRDP